jgi:anti-sigma B factor antagonist
MLLEISERRAGDVTVLTLRGRLVLDEGDEVLRQRVDGLVAEGRVKLVMNLGDVSYIDSAGLGTLAAKYVTAHRDGGDVRLCRLSERSRHIIEITNLSRVFRLFESEDEAVESYGVGVSR